MEHPKHLLALPYELRDMIWACCSATGDANGLLRCCRQTKEEFTRYCVLPKDVSHLDKLKILVDSTYDHGIWLKFDYTWQQNGHTRRAVSAVRHMGEPIVRRVAKTIKINEITIHLHAPRRGHFVGALLMMLAKADDAYFFIYAMSRYSKFNKDDPGRIAIKFSTEMVQSGQSAKEAKNFWECRAPKVLEDPMRKYLSHSGPMPCFYEYFLRCNFAFPSVPEIEYERWPRRHVHRTYKMPDPEDIIPYATECYSALLPDLQKHIKKRAAYLMANYVISCDETVYDHTGDPVHSSWEHINYDSASLACRYLFLLDNLAGPVGGCLDMLRLHRFKTMDAISVDYFARAENRAGNDDAGLFGASSKVTRQLRALFEPLATDHVVGLRSTCPHLCVVEWPTTSSSSQLSSDAGSRWLESYPNGIRYHWGGQNLVDWRFGWEAKLFEEHYKPYRARVPELWVSWINKSWECRGCCQDSICWMMELGDAHNRRRLRKLNAPGKARHFIHSINAVNRYASEQEQDHGRPMLVRRECFRRIMPRHQDPFYISFCGYRKLAFECSSWARTSCAKETPEDRKWYGDICSEYSAAALRGDGDVAK
ncbi:hypothetical protein HG530_010265 [Fusarium avenaceum]|nr:hypothetical protein HG530_010265 [Fusarium avenaceum]